MSEKDQPEQNSEKKSNDASEEIKETQPVENEEEKKGEEEPKAKFKFKCSRVDTCCMHMGPIPLTMWDLEMWARNNVVANFLPYIDIYQKPDGILELILKPLPPPKEADDKIPPTDPFTENPISELLDAKCPMYNVDQKSCLVYSNRPLRCRNYPLEFDGQHFSVDVDCPGVGNEGMNPEELKEMRTNAKTEFYELTRMRIATPILNQIISNNFMKMLMKQQMEAMSKMTDEDRDKLDEIFKKQEDEHDHDHDHGPDHNHEH
ncbi:MAG: YkgJ family cysteine cluster protein [Promethearchaeota archaeon]|jgi:Fe-S-cluster containining protein